MNSVKNSFKGLERLRSRETDDDGWLTIGSISSPASTRINKQESQALNEFCATVCPRQFCFRLHRWEASQIQLLFRRCFQSLQSSPRKSVTHSAVTKKIFPSEYLIPATRLFLNGQGMFRIWAKSGMALMPPNMAFNAASFLGIQNR